MTVRFVTSPQNDSYEHRDFGEFPKIRVPYLGVLIIRILLFRVLDLGSLFSETPI